MRVSSSDSAFLVGGILPLWLLGASLAVGSILTLLELLRRGGRRLFGMIQDLGLVEACCFVCFLKN